MVGKVEVVPHLLLYLVDPRPWQVQVMKTLLVVVGFGWKKVTVGKVEVLIHILPHLVDPRPWQAQVMKPLLSMVVVGWKKVLDLLEVLH